MLVLCAISCSLNISSNSSSTAAAGPALAFWRPYVNKNLAAPDHQWSSRSNGVMPSDRLAEKTKRAAAFKTDCSH